MQVGPIFTSPDFEIRCEHDDELYIHMVNPFDEDDLIHLTRAQATELYRSLLRHLMRTEVALGK